METLSNIPPPPPPAGVVGCVDPVGFGDPVDIVGTGVGASWGEPPIWTGVLGPPETGGVGEEGAAPGFPAGAGGCPSGGGFGCPGAGQGMGQSLGDWPPSGAFSDGGCRGIFMLISTSTPSSFISYVPAPAKRRKTSSISSALWTYYSLAHETQFQKQNRKSDNEYITTANKILTKTSCVGLRALHHLRLIRYYLSRDVTHPKGIHFILIQLH